MVHDGHLLAGGWPAEQSGNDRPLHDEALRLKAARALVREHKEVLQEAVGAHQFGAGRPAGAETLVHTVQAVASQRPRHAPYGVGARR